MAGEVGLRGSRRPDSTRARAQAHSIRVVRRITYQGAPKIHSTMRASPASGKAYEAAGTRVIRAAPLSDTSARNIPAQRMGREGFEPSTLGLRVPCSTN